MDSVTFDPRKPVAAPRGQQAGARHAKAQGPSWLSFYLVLIVIGLGMGLVLGLPLVDGTRSELHVAGGLLMFLGSTTGLIGTYLALVMVVLASRMPALERMLGQGGVIHWHRRLAPWPLILIAAHAVLLTLAYAQAAKTGPLSELGTIVNTFPNMVTATVALGLMMLIGLISIRQIRTRLSRENWWIVHLFMYVALILSFAHEVVLGPSFVGHPLTQLTWTIAWLVAAALVLTYRVAMPIYRTRRHALKVAEVRHEGPGVVSIILKGQNLERLAIAGGQFFEWRFLTPSMWWQAHPFSVSALPKPPYMRLTVQDAGDFTRALATLKVSTSVAVEGPYGSFTAFAAKRTHALLIAGGVGVTAARSLLEDLPAKSRPVVVLRVSRDEDLILANEIEELVRHKKGEVHRLIGHRNEVSLEVIKQLVPDISQRDVFISGSEGFVASAVHFAQRAGVAPGSIHQEAYAI
ncbi:MAG: oxidoreductase [Acidobacteria bacterium]|nr:oxidoreductase [Acidobacteriota bacterium]